MTPGQLARLHAAAAAEAGGRPWSTDEFAGLIAAPGALLTTRGTQSFALARLVADEGEVLMVATHPDARRRGLARACLRDLHRAAAERGAARLFLEVGAGNTAAGALYASEGYRRAGLRRGYYATDFGPAQDAIVMTRDLVRPPSDHGAG